MLILVLAAFFFGAIETVVDSGGNRQRLLALCPTNKMPWRPILPAVLMAVANVSGSIGGTWLALKHGSTFIRQVFLLLMGVLIIIYA
ncbi:MAG: hypothetical protein U0989_05805 [Azonexus sp.]|nr:hypothetical protein [Azonexus sp.]MDP3637725.1 hypothetical protein [Azonexus sp.]MDZ4314264.1 hypothetical protein [Azonexus sp.]